jgi:hypothetical protein
MTHRETGYAQCVLTVVFLVGYFVTLRDFVHGNVKVPIEWKETLQALLSVLTAGVLLILNYWFARQRGSTDPGAGKE